MRLIYFVLAVFLALLNASAVAGIGFDGSSVVIPFHKRSLFHHKSSDNDVVVKKSIHPLTNETRVKVEALWHQLEQHSPIEHAHVENVIETPSYVELGPDPQKQIPYVAHTLTTSRIDHLHFPHDFIIGVTQAAATHEGAVKADGRGPSIWDSFAHVQHLQHANVTTSTTFDVATNFRYLYPLDLARAKAMGIRHYAFSISWSRVFPMGYGEVSLEGLQFYIDLASEVIRQGMEPIVTLFHWDVPLQLELHYGGFSSERIVEDFVHYAKTIFDALGPLGVKKWFTFDGPQTFCLERYPSIVKHIRTAVPTNASAVDAADAQKALPWQCVGHILKAHGRTWQVFKAMRDNGTALDIHARLAYKNAGEKSIAYRSGGNHGDQRAIDRSEKFYMNLFAEPVYKTGTYPSQVLKEVPQRWLPILTKEDKERIKGSADFMATNYFASNIFKATDRQGGYDACVHNTSHVAWPSCLDHCTSLADGQLIGERADESLHDYLANTAGMLRAHLRWLYDEFPSRGGIYITALGWAERDEDRLGDIDEIRHDVGRQHYMRDHLAESLLAIYKDGIPLKGIFVWSSNDGIEWDLGHKPRFGMQYVDFVSANLTRTYLGSFFMLRQFFEKHN